MMLAKAMDGIKARAITKPGELVGNIAYMAPERTRSDVEVDTRADIYGLGATLYALLTGKPPFEGKSLVETIAAIRQADPVPLKKFQLSIPDQFQDAVMKMLAKRPEMRFQTPAEAARALERVAKFQGIELLNERKTPVTHLGRKYGPWSRGARAHPAHLDLVRIQTPTFFLAGFSREAFQSVYRVLSSSTVTPPCSSPEFHRSMRALCRSRSGPRGRNLPWNFLRNLRRGSAGGRGGALAFSSLAAAAAAASAASFSLAFALAFSLSFSEALALSLDCCD